jgi:ribA/ribD-fused uncharacterized protein
VTIRFYGTRGPHGFLSNFYPVIFELDGMQYPSSEHAYQASKTLDPDVHFKIRAAGTAGEACRLGRACERRSDWEEVVGTPALAAKFMDDQGCVVELVKDHFMYSTLIAKFSIPTLRSKLLSTGAEELIEASPVDGYWGEAKGFGKNKLGRMLQLIRAGARA